MSKKPSALIDKKVLVVGDLMTDIIVKSEGKMVRGSDCRAVIRSMPGGSGTNQALWLAQFDVSVSLVAKVGQRDLAQEEARLRERQVRPCLAADPTLPTGTLVTMLDPDGQRSFFTDRGANEALDLDDLPDSLLGDLTVLHISGYALFSERPRLAVLDLMARAKQRDIMVTVDPGSMGFLLEIGPENFLDWTKGAAICFPNEDEAAVLTASLDPDEQYRKLAGYYDLTVIKRGAKGAEIVDATGRCLFQEPSLRVKVVDTTGAGDAFMASFLAARLDGDSLQEALQGAVAAGATATTFFGGQPPLAAG